MGISGRLRVIAFYSHHLKNQSIHQAQRQMRISNIKIQIPNEGWWPLINIRLSVSMWAGFMDRVVHGMHPDKPAPHQWPRAAHPPFDIWILIFDISIAQP
jgi:hypothetical protein